MNPFFERFRESESGIVVLNGVPFKVLQRDAKRCSKIEFLFKEPLITQDLFSAIPVSSEALLRILDETRTVWESAAAFDAATLEAGLKTVIDALGFNKKHVMMTIRLAATGRKVTPPLFESLSVLGRRRTLDRIAHARDVLSGVPK